MNSLSALGLLITCTALISADLPTEGIDEQWEKTLLTIEENLGGGKVKVHGSGFLVSIDQQQVLTTAKHVVLGASVTTNLIYRYRVKSGASALVDEPLLRSAEFGGWYFHPTADVACRLFGFDTRTEFDSKSIPTNLFIKTTQLRPGARVVVSGFPAGIRDPDFFRPILRQGMVSQVEKSLVILDAPVFGGNSGGPAIYIPLIKLRGSNNEIEINVPTLQEDRLVGVVSAVRMHRSRVLTDATLTEALLKSADTNLTAVLTNLVTLVTNIVAQDAMGIVRVEPVERINEVLAIPEFVQVRQQQKLKSARQK